MNFVRQIILGVMGLSAGITTAAGVYALITVVGMIPRLAGKSRTGKYIHFYELAVIFGGICGCVIQLYQIPILGGRILLGILGIFYGIFITGKYIHFYELAVIFGGICGCVIQLYQIPILGGRILLGILGIFYGIFIGSLIMSLTEILDVFPIMTRRIRLIKGLPYIVLALAMGKSIGAFLFFWKGW